MKLDLIFFFIPSLMNAQSLLYVNHVETFEELVAILEEYWNKKEDKEIEKLASMPVFLFCLWYIETENGYDVFSTDSDYCIGPNGLKFMAKYYNGRKNYALLYRLKALYLVANVDADDDDDTDDTNDDDDDVVYPVSAKVHIARGLNLADDSKLHLQITIEFSDNGISYHMNISRDTRGSSAVKGSKPSGFKPQGSNSATN